MAGLLESVRQALGLMVALAGIYYYSMALVIMGGLVVSTITRVDF